MFNKSSFFAQYKFFMKVFGNIFIESIFNGTPIITCAKGGPEFIFKWAKMNGSYIGEICDDNVKSLNDCAKLLISKINQINFVKISHEAKLKFSSLKFLEKLVEANNEILSNNNWWCEND